MRNFLLLIFFLLVLHPKIMHAQSDTLTRQEFVGNWHAYMIMDTTAYFATPDSLKIADSLGIDILHFKMITYHVNENGTIFITSEYMKTLEGTWTLNEDTLSFYQEEGRITGAARVVYIARGRIQLCTREEGKRPVMHYVFLEKVE